MRLLSFILLLALVVYGCRKDDCGKQTIITASYDTILPHPYLPAYPGSWWEYNDSIRTETLEDWQVFKYREYTGGNCGSYAVDSIFLPVTIDKKERFLYYDRYISQDEYCYKDHSVHVLFNTEADQWESWYDPTYCFYTKGGHTEPVATKNRILVEELDAMTINGTVFNDIKVIKEEDRYSGHLSFTRIYYYAKNVGIIREIHDPADPADTVNIDTLDLTGYFIAN